MKSWELEDLICQSLDVFYHQQAKKLAELRLSDIFPKKITFFLRVIGLQGSSEIVNEMLNAYIPSPTESIFRDAFWQELIEEPDFYLKLISLMSDYPTRHRVGFKEEWDKAINRFTLEFIINFNNADSSIDWEKLLRFSSGKEKITWMSRKALVVSVEDEKDNDNV